MTIHEHSFDETLLPKRAFILDCGCRDFKFSDYFRELGHSVYSVDIDKLDRSDYYQFAISDKQGNCDIHYNCDPSATKMKDGTGVEVHTLKSFSEFVEVKEWDLIKMDIEGAEFDVLSRAEHPIAKQVSVEFHAHCGQTKQDIDALLDRLSQWYTIENRIWEQRHGCSENYWDVLLIAKS